jgi:hypothetical protein
MGSGGNEVGISSPTLTTLLYGFDDADIECRRLTTIRHFRARFINDDGIVRRRPLMSHRPLHLTAAIFRPGAGD